MFQLVHKATSATTCVCVCVCVCVRDNGIRCIVEEL